MTKKSFIPIPPPAELPDPETIDVEGIAAAYLAGDIDIICVVGPTASGKTRYAVALARKLDALMPDGRRCEILSADSRQVYRDMTIGTGKDLDEYEDVPYHLIDIVEPGIVYNIWEYQRDFAAAYADVRSRRQVPILCGGSGLYVETATCAYEFGKGAPRAEGLPSKPYYIGTLVTREERRARIDRRLDERLEEGMVDEIRALLERGVSADSLIHYGLEYKFVTQYVLGEISYDYMKERLAIAIHQFAKRQMTWFRGMERSGIRIHWTLPE